MKMEFTKDGVSYAVFLRSYGYAVYIRDTEGGIAERVGGFTEREFEEDFPEAFQ